MQYRKFGNTDLMVSEIGFGAWAIGGNTKLGDTAIGWGKVNDDDSKKAIASAVEAGINFFDTADFYGLGHSEKMLGETLQLNRDILVATKVGHRNINERFEIDYSGKYIMTACEESLRRLRREAIDYYQLHSARVEHLEESDCLAAMELLKQQGKIRYWGLSLNTFHPFPEANYMMKHRMGDGLQLVLNIINQISLPLVKEASANGYGIIARMPLQFGLLTGKFSTASSFSSDDHRHKRLTPAIITESLKALEPVWLLAEKYQITKAQLALSYIVSYPQINTVIPGIRTEKHVKENTSNLVCLSPDEIAMIEGLVNGKFSLLMELIKQQG